MLTLLVSLTAGAQEAGKPRIAVLPLKATDVPASVVQSVTSLIETNLVNTNMYTVVSNTDRDQVLKAQETALAGCDDEECAIRIGKLLSAQQIVVGTISTLGKKVIINARIIDISTSQIVGAESASAINVEDLEQACAVLTKALVSRAAPGTRTAQKPETKPTSPAKPPEAETPKPTAPAQPQPSKPPAQAGTSGARGGGSEILGIVVMSGAAGLLEAANVVGTVSFESGRKSVTAYEKYLGATSDFDALYGAYQSAYNGYSAFGITSYAVWGTEAVGLSASLFLFPQDTFRLSLLGRIAYASSLLLSLSGNVAGFMAGNLSITNAALYDSYMQATEDWDAYYQRYQAGYSNYTLTRILSYSLWGVGGAGMVASFLLPGEKTPFADGILSEILISGGSLLVAGGSYLQSMALNTRQSAENKYKKYMEATSSFDALYADYQASYNRYKLFSVLSYALWAGGGVATILPLFVPFGGTAASHAAAELPLHVSLIPIPDGMELDITLALRSQ